MYGATVGTSRYVFPDLKTLLAKATPTRSGDRLAGIAAASGEERVAAQYALADLPLATFLTEHVVPYESDEVTRLIIDGHDAAAFAPIAHLTVGGLRDWLLSDAPTADELAALAPGITPEMAAAVSKISRLQDLMVMAAKCSVVTRFRNTIGLPGRLSVRLQPNHPTDDLAGIAASILDGLLLGAGDAVIGINPATDSPERAHALLAMLEEVRLKLDTPTQMCVLAQRRGGLHRAGISLRRQGDHARRARGPFLRQAARRADGGRRLLHQSRRGRPGRHGRAARAAHLRGRQLRHGRARRRRHHAALSEHVVPRRARHARPVRPPPGPGIRGLARATRPRRCRCAHPPARRARALPRAAAGVRRTR